MAASATYRRGRIITLVQSMDELIVAMMASDVTLEYVKGYVQATEKVAAAFDITPEERKNTPSA